MMLSARRRTRGDFRQVFLICIIPCKISASAENFGDVTPKMAVGRTLNFGQKVTGHRACRTERNGTVHLLDNLKHRSPYGLRRVLLVHSLDTMRTPVVHPRITRQALRLISGLAFIHRR